MKENLEIRDRVHAVVLALKKVDGPEIADQLGYGIAWVRKWAYRYRDHGWSGLWDQPRPGQPKKLTADQEKEVSEWIEKGPTLESDGVTRFRIKDLKVRLLDRFGVKYSVSGVKKLVHRLGFSSIKPRPRHPQNDPKKMKKWKKKTAPQAISLAKKNIRRKK